MVGGHSVILGELRFLGMTLRARQTEVVVACTVTRAFE